MTNKTAQLKQALENRILILDGAMGTMIQKYKLTEADFRGEKFKESAVDLRGNNDLLTLTQPLLISAIHEKYLAAGADISEFIFVGKKVTVKDGKCYDEFGALGGASVTMIESIQNLIHHQFLPTCQRMYQ